MQPIHISNQLNNFQYPTQQVIDCQQNKTLITPPTTVVKATFAVTITACVVLALLVAHLFIFIALMQIGLLYLILIQIPPTYTPPPLQPLPSEEPSYEAYRQKLTEMENKTYTFPLKENLLEGLYKGFFNQDVKKLSHAQQNELKQQIEEQLQEDLLRDAIFSINTPHQKYDLRLLSKNKSPTSVLQEHLKNHNILSEKEQISICGAFQQGVFAEALLFCYKAFQWNNETFFVADNNGKDKRLQIYELDLTEPMIAKVKSIYSYRIKDDENNTIARGNLVVTIPNHRADRTYLQLSMEPTRGLI